jgi:hypothetical protein
VSELDLIAEAHRRLERRKKGLPLNETPEELAEGVKAKDERLEKEIQSECVRIYRAHGCIVYETSQKRRAKVSPGIPDLMVFHAAKEAFWFHEVKTPRGSLSPAQEDFRDRCAETGTLLVWGGVDDARAALRVYTNQLPEVSA